MAKLEDGQQALAQERLAAVDRQDDFDLSQPGVRGETAHPFTNLCSGEYKLSTASSCARCRSAGRAGGVASQALRCFRPLALAAARLVVPVLAMCWIAHVGLAQ